MQSHPSRSTVELKDTLSSDTVLGYYEPDQETKLLVDASTNGLGYFSFKRNHRVGKLLSVPVIA